MPRLLVLLLLLVVSLLVGSPPSVGNPPALYPPDVEIARLYVDLPSAIADGDNWPVWAPPFDTTATTLDCVAHDGTTVQFNVYADHAMTTQIGATITCTPYPGPAAQTGLAVDVDAWEHLRFDVVDGSNTGVTSVEIAVVGLRR